MVAIAEKINNGEKCFHIACDPHITKSPQSSSTGWKLKWTIMWRIIINNQKQHYEADCN